MKAAIVSDHSFLQKQELSQKFNLSSSDKGFFVLADFDHKSLVKSLYLSQCANYFLLNPVHGTFTNFDDLLDKLNFSFDFVVKIECTRSGTHNFRSVDVISKLANKNFNTDINKYDQVLRIIINDDKFVAGICASGFDLGKRDYKVFNHPNSIKGTLASFALVFSDVKDKVVLDPLSLSGEVAIETVFYQNKFSVHFFNKDFNIFKLPEFSELKNYLSELDSETKPFKNYFVYSFDPKHRNVNAQKKNARIAGVDKYITYGRFDSYDIDLKSYKKIPDLIITRPLEPSKRVNEDHAFKVNRTFLDRLIDLGIGEVTFIARKPVFVKRVLEKNSFKLVKELTLKQGKDFFYLINAKR